MVKHGYCKIALQPDYIGGGGILTARFGLPLKNFALFGFFATEPYFISVSTKSNFVWLSSRFMSKV